MSMKKPQKYMAVRLLEYFRVFGKTNNDINISITTDTRPSANAKQADGHRLFLPAF